jgi:hypothetical protein
MDRSRRLCGGDWQKHNKEGTQGGYDGTAKSDSPANYVHRHPSVQAFHRMAACSGMELW